MLVPKDDKGRLVRKGGEQLLYGEEAGGNPGKEESLSLPNNLCWSKRDV